MVFLMDNFYTMMRRLKKRWAFSFEHNQHINKWLSAYLNLEKVSDNSYPDDFGKKLSEYSKRLYVQEGGLKVSKENEKHNLQILARYKYHQALNDIPPYNISPQFNIIYD